MTSPLVLLTGATGFVGAHTLEKLITNNHHVIVPIRPSSLQKTDFFMKKYSGYPGALKFVEVADQTDKAVMLSLLKGVTAVIHMASIIPGREPPAGGVEKDLLEPVIGMITALFEASLQVDTIKRFVLTSSSVAIFRTLDTTKKEYTEDDWNSLTLDEVKEEWNPTNGYTATKLFGERKLWELTKEKKPSFDVVVICLPMVCGTSAHEVKDMSRLGGPAGSVLFNSLLGKTEVPENGYPQFINATDSAAAHFAAITAPLTRTPEIPHRYLVSGGTFSFHRVINALLKRYPDLEGKLPKADPAKLSEILVPFGTEKAKKELGIQLDMGWEKSIVEDLFGSADQVVRSGGDWSDFGGSSMLKKD